MPVSRVLIANRGEIACRIIRSVRKEGLKSIAVYSDADADALHVRLADIAVRIGPAAAAQSYLDMDAVLAAARETKADSIHPGYGFLSENAAFARRCAESGIVFIGPSSTAIDAMGDKGRSKQTMKAAGVPCIPGYEGANQTLAAFEAAAETIGYPVMLKASAGGGGRGMRIVGSKEELERAFLSAKSEAASAFKSDHLILEKAIIGARHIEVQVLGDKHGSIVHLGERDCSLQRRHQKIIEEAPSSIVSEQLRAKLGAAAVAAARAVRYDNAGTIEFLMDADENFYFMEMNTRLQVEHPVTEAITGLDLVSLQLRIASGEKLLFSQADITFRGHAIEARICAEDPAKQFMPRTGFIGLWRAPIDEEVRVDAAIDGPTKITPNYDSLIAKVVAHGATRDIARRKLIAALEELVILGVVTSTDFVLELLNTPEFASGNISTNFVADYARQTTRKMPDERTFGVAAVLWALNAGFLQKLRPGEDLGVRLSYQKDQRDVLMKKTDAGYTVSQRGAYSVVRVVNSGDHDVEAIVDGKTYDVAFVTEQGMIHLKYDNAADFRFDNVAATILQSSNAQAG